MESKSPVSDQKIQIKPINVDTVHKICSGQVVLSLGVAVKELVENALDAGATNIDIRLKNYGTDLIEVSDNGSGVTEDNFAALTMKYYTSKITEYSDLLGVSSFGFRGEALSSLCALANLTVTTRHKSSEYATQIEYNHKGVINKMTRCSRQIGTTVSLTNLFHSLPVRQKEFLKNVKREFNKMTQLLYAYCLISLGVKITCTNHSSSNSKSVVVATQGSTIYKDNIASIFGLKQLQTILEIKPECNSNIKENIFRGLSQTLEHNDTNIPINDLDIDLSEDSNENEDVITKKSVKSQGYKNINDTVEFTGYVSSCAHGSGRSSSDRQFFYVNSRPCEPTKVIKLINEIYRQYNPNQYPFIFLNINMERSSVDINVTPDKRKVFLIKEKSILNVLKYSLIKLFENIPRTLKIESSLSQCSQEVKPDIDQPRIFNSFLQQFTNKYKLCKDSVNGKTTEKTELKRKSTSMLDYISPKTMKTESNSHNRVDYEDNIEFNRDNIVSIVLNESDVTENSLNNYTAENKLTDNIKEDKANSKENIDLGISNGETCDALENKSKDIMYLEFTDNLPNTQIRDVTDVISKKPHIIYCGAKSNSKKENIANISDKKSPVRKSKVQTDKEDLGKNHRKSVVLKTSIEHIRSLCNKYTTSETILAPKQIKFKSEINPVFNKKCEEELTREISKDSFKNMIVVGQFNLGFIITRLKDDLFIIDQHATDEIYNFEMLQKSTELISQKLVIPQQLELTGVNEEILKDNLNVFKKNGFTFEIDENALPTKRVRLLTVPMSKNWIFGKEDIEELLFMLRESPSEYCRPSRVRAMFASRACRKSVMIGTALKKLDMKVLVNHMSEIDKPWNCPHGRPTIRHLVNLAMIHTKQNSS